MYPTGLYCTVSIAFTVPARSSGLADLSITSWGLTQLGLFSNGTVRL